MAILLALLAATTYGAGDFFGGFAARHSPAVRVTLLSQVVGALILLPLVPLVAGSPNAHDVLLGAVAGVAGACAVSVFYRAMGMGAMSVVAPISALTAAALPVVVGLVTGERPSTAALVGVAIALAAILLVSGHGPEADTDTEVDRPAPGTSRRSMVLMAALSGALFGLLFVILDGVPDGAGLWPLVGARAASVPLLVVVAVATRTPVRPAPGTMAVIAACGAFDMLANVFLLLAFGQGLLVLVAVITSLYPASTLVLARVVLHERVSPIQRVGLAVAGLAVVLIAAS